MKDQAIPFALGALLTVLGATSSWVVQRRMHDFARQRGSGGSGGGAHTSALGQSQIAGWATDAAQAFVVGFAPLVGAVTLVDGIGKSLVLVCTAATVASMIMFVGVLYTDPDKYMQRSLAGAGVVTWIGLALNLALGAGAQFL